jgi:hypothetical protein
MKRMSESSLFDLDPNLKCEVGSGYVKPSIPLISRGFRYRIRFRIRIGIEMEFRIRLLKLAIPFISRGVSVQDPVSDPYRYRNGMSDSATKTGHSIISRGFQVEDPVSNPFLVKMESRILLQYVRVPITFISRGFLYS